MSRLTKLKSAASKNDLALILDLKVSFLTNVLYRIKPERQYYQFKIPKKNGGERIINAPSSKLKTLQSRLSTLLLDCIDDINKIKYPNPTIKYPNPKVKHPTPQIKKSTLAHGFVRKHSIFTNAMMHLNQKSVLNIDLNNFFDSFNFGRVRGFFIKNENFKLHPDIATVIAQIACYDNKLPQGSPCSPVITNLITHSLDIRLASLANKHSCTYSRYADDITFSTRKSTFPTQIMNENDGGYAAGKKLRSEIKRAGFTINSSKTRIQYEDSRQDVTGLVVNKKPNIKKEYWQTARLQCHRLFKTGAFTKNTANGAQQGNINELEGQLNFIDQIDLSNRLRQKKPLNKKYGVKDHGKHTKGLISGRERTFSQFLYFRLFYANDKPTILCEGQTDNVYLKSAISELVTHYPKLASAKTNDKCYELLIRFVEYSKRTRFLLELYGGVDYLKGFIEKFHSQYSFYTAPKPEHPVIIILDNDSGPDKLIKYLKSKKLSESLELYPTSLNKTKDHRRAEFIHVMHNLYILLTPLANNDEPTDIEYFFDDVTRMEKHNGKPFNTVENRNTTTDLSKEAFAKHIIKAKKNTTNFDGLKPILTRVVQIIEHYDNIKITNN